jgi:hypothetical protein
MPDDHGKVIEIEFHDYRGWLFVNLDRATFEKVFSALQESTDSTDLAEIDVSEVWQLLVYDSTRNPKPVRSRTGFSY